MVHPEDVGQLLPRLDMSMRLGVYVRSRGGDGLIPHLILILRVRNGKETLPLTPCPVAVAPPPVVGRGEILVVRGCGNVADKLMQRWKTTAGTNFAQQ